MKFPPMRRILAPFLIAMMLFVTACGDKAPTRWDKAQQESTQKPVKTRQTNAQQPNQTSNAQKLPNKPVAGGKLNRFFPPNGGGYTRTFAQEKAGFAEAKLKQGGKDVAMLSINDIAGDTSPTNPATKFEKSTQKIGGYPAVKQGSKTTAVLVANRYQVKVQSKDPSFSASDREDWLEKFNLSDLAKLK